MILHVLCTPEIRDVRENSEQQFTLPSSIAAIFQTTGYSNLQNLTVFPQLDYIVTQALEGDTQTPESN